MPRSVLLKHLSPDVSFLVDLSPEGKEKKERDTFLTGHDFLFALLDFYLRLNVPSVIFPILTAPKYCDFVCDQLFSLFKITIIF